MMTDRPSCKDISDWELYQELNRDRPNRSKMEQFTEFNKANTGWLPLWKLNWVHQTKPHQQFIAQPETESIILKNVSFLSACLLNRSQLNHRSNKESVQRGVTDFKIIEPYDIGLETFCFQKDGQWYRMSVFPCYESLTDMETDYKNASNGSDFWIDRRTLY